MSFQKIVQKLLNEINRVRSKSINEIDLISISIYPNPYKSLRLNSFDFNPKSFDLDQSEIE